MKEDNIINNIKRRKYYLNMIHAKKIDEKPEYDSAKVLQKTEYEILENKDDKLSMKISTKIFMEPEAFFSIEMEHIIEYILKYPISNTEVEKAIDILVKPLGSEISFLVSSITKEMLNTRVILPPKLDFN